MVWHSSIIRCEQIAPPRSPLIAGLPCADPRHGIGMQRAARVSQARPARFDVGAWLRVRRGRVATPGRCANFDYCSVGMQRVLVQVPVEDPFICPECAGPLRAPHLMGRSRRPVLLPLLRLAVLAGGMSFALIGGYVIGRTRAGTGLAADAALRAAPARPDRPQSSPAVPAAAVGLPGHVQLVSAKPYPMHLGPVDVTSPPARLQHEVRFGQVTIDCQLAAGQLQPRCTLADIRGANTFFPAALTWLQGLAIRYEALPGPGASAPADHRWRIMLEDFSGTARPAAASPR
jgi:hypothetical protein